MKTIRIYSRRLAERITENGIEFIRVVPDVAHPKFVNWIFEDTPELRQEMEKYSKERRQVECPIKIKMGNFFLIKKE